MPVGRVNRGRKEGAEEDGILDLKFLAARRRERGAKMEGLDLGFV
jgi:hypothetical protein